MPNATFFNLPDNKREIIVSAALDEFSQSNYDAASINQICKKSKIPKGSFYQYFEDKMDLYVYIMSLAIDEKIKFFSTVLDDFQNLTLLEQIKLLFLKGLEFAKTFPRFATLGEQFTKENNKDAVAAVVKEGEKQSESLFNKMIESAKLKGEIYKDVDSLALSLVLQSLNNAVNEYMIKKYGDINYENYQEDINTFIDSLLYIIFNGIKNK